MSVYLSKSLSSDEFLATSEEFRRLLASLPAAPRMNDVGSLHQFHLHPSTSFVWSSIFCGLDLDMEFQFEFCLRPVFAAFSEGKRVFGIIGKRIATQGGISFQVGAKEKSTEKPGYEGGPLVAYSHRRSGQPPWLELTYSRSGCETELHSNLQIAADFFNHIAKLAEAPVCFWTDGDKLMTKPLAEGTDVTEEPLTGQTGFYCRLPAGRSDFDRLVDVAENAVRRRGGSITYARLWLRINLTTQPGLYVPPAPPEEMAQNLLSWISEAEIAAKSIDLRMVARVISPEGFATIRALCGPKDQTLVYIANLKEVTNKSKDRVILGVITDITGHRLAIGSSKPLSEKELAEFGKRFGVEFYTKTARVKKVPFEYSKEEKHYFPPD